MVFTFSSRPLAMQRPPRHQIFWLESSTPATGVPDGIVLALHLLKVSFNVRSPDARWTIPMQCLMTHRPTKGEWPVPMAEGESGPHFEGGEWVFGHHHIAKNMDRRLRQILSPETQALAPLRVLCVDDNQDAADTQVAVLDQYGYEVRGCYDGPSALAIASEFRPDACLLDLSMPGMDGLELATQLKAQAGRQPLLFIATTALGDWENQTQTALAGFHYHMIKPVDTNAVLTALNRFAAMLHQGPPSCSPFPDETPH